MQRRSTLLRRTKNIQIGRIGDYRERKLVPALVKASSTHPASTHRHALKNADREGKPFGPSRAPAGNAQHYGRSGALAH